MTPPRTSRNSRNPRTTPDPQKRLLITAGPTQEPIDDVRYLGNRSSGRLGIALALAAAEEWDTTLLLGPTARLCEDTRVRVERFRTTADLQALLARHAPRCDALIMAAAVADYRPIPMLGLEPAPAANPAGSATTHPPGSAPGHAPEHAPGHASTNGRNGVASKPAAAGAPAPPRKLRRAAARLTIELESTPDLLAAAAAARRPGQVFVGFALEPRETLLESAREKLARKRVDMIVANPLETMDSEAIEAWLLSADGAVETTGRPIAKQAFAEWLLERVSARLAATAVESVRA